MCSFDNSKENVRRGNVRHDYLLRDNTISHYLASDTFPDDVTEDGYIPSSPSRPTPRKRQKHTTTFNIYEDPQPSTSSDDGAWAYTTCTVINSDDMLECHGCCEGRDYEQEKMIGKEMGLDCGKCTFKNPNTSNVCILCDAARFDNSDTTVWKCTTCTLDNEASATKCAACDAARDTGPEYEEESEPEMLRVEEEYEEGEGGEDLDVSQTIPLQPLPTT